MKEVMAVWTISNVSSLNVWEMKNDEAMLVGINNDEPEWCEIEWKIDQENDSDVISGINFHGTFRRLDECMKIKRSFYV